MRVLWLFFQTENWLDAGNTIAIFSQLDTYSGCTIFPLLYWRKTDWQRWTDTWRPHHYIQFWLFRQTSQIVVCVSKRRNVFSHKCNAFVIYNMSRKEALFSFSSFLILLRLFLHTSLMKEMSAKKFTSFAKGHLNKNSRQRTVTLRRKVYHLFFVPLNWD